MGPGLAEALAEWAHGLQPDGDDLALAGRSLADTVAVALAARDHPVTHLAACLPDGARWATVAPLIHHRPDTGMQGKFSLAYAAAAAVLDPYPGLASFTDEAVRRPAARRLAGLVETKLDPGGSWLLDGELAAEIHTAGGVLETTLRFPPGAPQRPPTAAQLQAKVADCVTGLDAGPASWTWDSAAEVLGGPWRG